MQRIFLLVLLSQLMLACGGGSSSGSTSTVAEDSCTIPAQNEFVHRLMQDAYLWYTEIPASVDYSAFSSPEETLEFLRFDALDRFSFITDAQQFSELIEAGRFTGYGFSFLIGADDSLHVRFVYANSSAGRAGLQRGDRILSLNNESVAEIILSSGFDRVLGPDEAGIKLDMVVQKPDASTVTLSLTKGVVNINSVLHSSLINGQPQPTGYLVFNNFLETSGAELGAVFAQFNAVGVKRLILDLRYNGGGSVPVAAELASYLHRVSDNSQLFIQLGFNDKNQDANRAFFLQPTTDALLLDELIIIATGETCSASEMIISGLKPYAANVRVVGSKTCGKPVGMSSFENCGKAVLPVIFESRNRDGEGDYYDGLAAHCSVSDTINRDFGDPAEPMLTEALFLLANGNCSSNRASRQQPAALPYPAYSTRAIIGAY